MDKQVKSRASLNINCAMIRESMTGELGKSKTKSSSPSNIENVTSLTSEEEKIFLSYKNPSKFSRGSISNSFCSSVYSMHFLGYASEFEVCEFLGRILKRLQEKGYPSTRLIIDLVSYQQLLGRYE